MGNPVQELAKELQNRWVLQDLKIVEKKRDWLAEPQNPLDRPVGAIAAVTVVVRVSCRLRAFCTDRCKESLEMN